MQVSKDVGTGLEMACKLRSRPAEGRFGKFRPVSRPPACLSESVHFLDVIFPFCARAGQYLEVQAEQPARRERFKRVLRFAQFPRQPDAKEAVDVAHER